jgi:hypothetical protein
MTTTSKSTHRTLATVTQVINDLQAAEAAACRA